MTTKAGLTFVVCALLSRCGRSTAPPKADPRAAELASEVKNVGWIAFGARSEKGDWDLYIMRPDGSGRRNLTNTPQYNEAAPRFSPDGRQLLFRRLRRDQTIDGNRYGAQGQLVIAASDGTRAEAIGGEGEYPWASWGPDGRHIACLSPKGISIVDLATRKTLRMLDRKGIFQQLSWSPDGRWFAGVANVGEVWTIVRMNAETGELNAVHEYQNCTPHWFADSQRLLFSYRPAGQENENKGAGWTQLYAANADGSNAALVYGEDGVHVYGNMPSPDGRYVVFTRSVEEDGDPHRNGSPLAIMRLGDAPAIGGQSRVLRKRFPQVHHGVLLDLPVGWKPHWALPRFPS